jgi:pimeloyl-ACP methyl ester carboxylesterase
MALGACCGNTSDERGRSGFEVSHPFARKKAKGWGTEYCGVRGVVSGVTRGAPRDLDDIRAIAAIGLPIRSGAARSEEQSYDYSYLSNCAIPKLFLSGDQDEFAPQADLIRAVAIAAPPKQTVLVPGADHFFIGQLEPMQSALSGWLKEYVL